MKKYTTTWTVRPLGAHYGGRYNSKKNLADAYKYGFDLGFVACGGKYGRGVYIPYGYDNDYAKSEVPEPSLYHPIIKEEVLSPMRSAFETRPIKSDAEMKQDVKEFLEKFSPYYSSANGGTYSGDRDEEPRKLPKSIVKKIEEKQERLEEMDELELSRW